MIYLVTHFYPPVGNPPANRLSHLARTLVARYGAQNVRVVTGRPNHPEGRLLPEDRWRLWRRDTGSHGEEIIHLYELPAANRAFLRKTLGYITFATSVFCFFLFRRMQPDDLVFVTTPPIFTAYSVYLLARLKRRFRYVVDIRDLWPQTVAGMGFIRPASGLYRALLRLSDRTYGAAVKCVGVYEGIRAHLATVGLADRMELVYNLVDTELFHPLPPQEVRDFRVTHPEWFPRGRCVGLYSGSHSIYMGLMTLLEALVQVRAATDRFHFLFIGYGEEKERMQQFVRDNGLGDHVCFLPHLPRAELLKFICAADYCFSATSTEAIMRICIPTKILEYMACDRFVVGTHDNDFVEALHRDGYALNAPAGDVAALTRNLLAILGDKGRRQPAYPPRAFVEQRFSHRCFEERMTRLFAALVPPEKG